MDFFEAKRFKNFSKLLGCIWENEKIINFLQKITKSGEDTPGEHTME